VLEKARGQAGQAGARGFGGMFEARKGSFGTVFSTQTSTAAADRSEQVAIQGKLAGIYARTKSDVDGTLGLLTKAVESLFSIQVELAKSTFESNVEDQLDDIYGWTVVDDWIFGADTEAIDAVFHREKERFLTTMGTVIDQIARLIATFLNIAIRRIETGRQEAKTFYDGLTTKQQKLSQEAYGVFQLQFQTLEDGVRAKEQELADALAESYRSNVDSLQESFNKIKHEVSRGWIGGAIDFIEGVAEVIGKLTELLFSVLSRVGNVIGDILAHPIRFVENLAAGIGAGFTQFIKNIDEYLVSGFFEWLRGSAGPAVKLPEKLDVAGLFNLATQVLGLDYAHFRAIAVKVWGRAAVELLEAGAAAAEKGLEIFRLVRAKGLAGLWAFIRASLSSLVEELIQKVKVTVLYAAIEKALTFVAGLFTPVGAFIRAAQTIYRGIRFLIDNIDRIVEIVDAFLSSVELAVAGKTDAIAQKIVSVLRRFIVVGIDFLAKLLGLGDLAAKVRGILKAVTAPFDRAVEAVLRGLKSLVTGVLRKFGVGRRKGEKGTSGEKGKDDQQPLSHDEVVAQVFAAMSKPTKAKTAADALAEKQKQAQDLVKEYQPRLKKGRLRIAVTDPGAKEVEEDAAVDFDVSASPGQAGEAPVVLTAGPGHAQDKSGKILVGSTGPYRSLSGQQDPRYKKYPFLKLEAEHVLPRAIIDRILRAMGFQGMSKFGSEYQDAQTVAIYDGAADIKTKRYDMPMLKDVESRAHAIAAPLRDENSDPDDRSTAHAVLAELIDDRARRSVTNTGVSVAEEDNTNRGTRGNDAALPGASEIAQVADAQARQAKYALQTEQAFLNRAAGEGSPNSPLNLATELNRRLHGAAVTSTSVAEATVKWVLKYPSWSRKDPTKETEGTKVVRIRFDGHAEGFVTWSIQHRQAGGADPMRMVSAGSGRADDTSALDTIEQALHDLRGRLQTAATARRDRRLAAAAAAGAPPEPPSAGDDSGTAE
jgi:hypothetical protein